MKKNIFLLLFLTYIALPVSNAQHIADYTVHYDFYCISDTLDRTYFPPREFMLLRVGHISTFITEGRYYNDSTNLIFTKEHPEPVIKTPESMQRYVDLIMARSDVKSVGSDYKIFKDHKSGTFRMMPPVLTAPAQYMEELMNFDWEITSETDTILGQVCIKALTYYGGRHYQVWFSPDIPISDGPWTFRGLPGLILKTSDEHGWYTFVATRIITKKTKRYLKPDWINEFSQKVDRKTFVDFLAGYKQNPPKPLGVLSFPEDRMLAIKKAFEKRFDLLLEQYK